VKQAKLLPLCFLILLCSFAANSSSEEKRSNVCPQDEAQFALARQKAAEEDPAAQTTLASCYDLGRHVQPDGREAIRLLTKAAEQGYEPAEYELGRI
jgi:TPR repeat protein